MQYNKNLFGDEAAVCGVFFVAVENHKSTSSTMEFYFSAIGYAEKSLDHVHYALQHPLAISLKPLCVSDFIVTNKTKHESPLPNTKRSVTLFYHEVM